MNIFVIHENEDYLWINKPAGIMVHGDGRNTEATLADWIIEHYPEIDLVGESWTHPETDERIPRPGIMHRLDKDTSGIMVIAKSDTAFDFLKQAFKERRVTKTYHAFVYEWPSQQEYSIDAPIGRHHKDFRAKSAGPRARGQLRQAHTHMQIMGKIIHQNERYAKIICRPTTGRTHQIRVHAKYIQHPLVADTLYGGKRAVTQSNLGFERHALHAHSLSFIDHNGLEHTYSAPYPTDFQRADEFFLAKKPSL